MLTSQSKLQAWIVVVISSRYYSSKDKLGQQWGHDIMPPSLIKKMIALTPTHEHHISMETYDNRTFNTGCNFILDIDSDNELSTTLQKTRHLCRKIRYYGIDYAAYYSGNRGFHIHTNLFVRGFQNNIMCKAIQKTCFDFDGVDSQIYRHNGTLRMIGSVHLKTGLHKVKVSLDESLESILSRAKLYSGIEVPHTTGFNNSAVIEAAMPLYKQMTANRSIEDISSFSVPFCIKAMMRDESPPRDLWHSIVYTLAKSLYASGALKDEAVYFFRSHKHWGNTGVDKYSTTQCVSVVNNIYNNGRCIVGCKHGISAPAMKYYCSKLCPINGGDIEIKF